MDFTALTIAVSSLLAGGGAADPIGPAEPAEHATLSDWTPCEGGLECATLTVPRDWADVEVTAAGDYDLTARLARK